MTTINGGAHAPAASAPNATSQSDVRDTSVESTATQKTTATPKHLRLFDLPQELQDIIFDFAYPEVPDLKLVTKKQWSDREYYERAKDSGYQVKPFPGPKAAEFLLSKAFFEAAIKAWLCNQWIEDSMIAAASDQVEKFGMGLIGSLLFQRVVNLLCGTVVSLGILNSCPSLKRVRATIRQSDFRSEAPRFAWEVLYSDDEIQSTQAYTWATKLRGLVLFEATADDNARLYMRDDSKGMEIWKQNVKRVEDLVKPLVFQAKPAEKKDVVEDSSQSLRRRSSRRYGRL